jgi:CBS domain containing-hemolysin-like protein
MEGPLWGVLLLMLVTSVLFSGSEAALFSLNPVQIRQIEARRDHAASCVRLLLRTPHRLLGSLLVGNTLANVGLSAVLTSVLMARSGADGLNVAIPVASALILIFGEILPKTLAVNFTRTAARVSAVPLVLILPVLNPLTAGVTWVSRALLRLLGMPDPEGGLIRPVTTSELRAVLEEMDDEGAGISKFESRLVQNILAFSRTTAEEVMTPRVDVAAARAGTARDDLVALIHRTRHSRIPLYENTLDEIIGYLPSRAFLLNRAARIADLVRPVLIVPEKAPVDRIFHDFRKERRRMAIVVNEFGETVGLITQEDLIEEIVGELFDEYELGEEEIVENEDGSHDVLGRASLQDLGATVETELPQEQAVTVNGFLCSLYGGFPKPGTVLRWEDLRFEILEVARHRVHKARVSRVPPEEGDEESD